MGALGGEDSGQAEQGRRGAQPPGSEGTAALTSTWGLGAGVCPRAHCALPAGNLVSMEAGGGTEADGMGLGDRDVLTGVSSHPPHQ